MQKAPSFFGSKPAIEVFKWRFLKLIQQLPSSVPDSPAKGQPNKAPSRTGKKRPALSSSVRRFGTDPIVLARAICLHQ